MRNIIITEGEFYHIYNRGTDKRNIFSDQEDVDRFFQSMSEFNVIEPINSIYENSFAKKKLKNSKQNLKLVDFVAFSLVENHYHFILKQISEKGIEKFMHRLNGGYTKYFNNKYKRSGVLFQGKYKAKHIDSDNYLLHLSVYVNLNQKVHQLGSRASKLNLYSSWGEYTGENKTMFCQKDIILGQFNDKNNYIKFAENALWDIILRKKISKEDADLYFD